MRTPGHHWVPRKVSGKELLADTDRLYTYGSDSVLQFHDLVYQQKRDSGEE